MAPFETGSGPFSLWNPLTCPRVVSYELRAFREMPGDHMDDRSRLAAAWALTFVLCVGLFATAYWNLHWGVTPFGG